MRVELEIIAFHTHPNITGALRSEIENRLRMLNLSQDPLLHKLATEYVDEAALSVRLKSLFEASPTELSRGIDDCLAAACCKIHYSLSFLECGFVSACRLAGRLVRHVATVARAPGYAVVETDCILLRYWPGPRYGGNGADQPRGALPRAAETGMGSERVLSCHHETSSELNYPIFGSDKSTLLCLCCPRTCTRASTSPSPTSRASPAREPSAPRAAA